MRNFIAKKDRPNYGNVMAPSLQLTLHSPFGAIQFIPTTISAPKEWTLDHSRSNLVDATEKYSPMSLEEVIRRVQQGELGSTEVEANQIW